MNEAKFRAALRNAVAQLNVPDDQPLDVKALMRVLGSTVEACSDAYEEGLRVEVFSGDQQTRIGLGTVVDHVTVFVGHGDDGSLRSLRFAEQPFEGSQEIGGNPKIQMDDGSVRYGCQVWWKPLKEAPAEAVN